MTALIIPYLKIVPYVMSDDEGGFDKEKLQELFGSNLTLQFFEASQSIPRQSIFITNYQRHPFVLTMLHHHRKTRKHNPEEPPSRWPSHLIRMKR